jgi:hypothetical protein
MNARALERVLWAKLLTVATPDGKLTPGWKVLAKAGGTDG